MSAGYDYVAVGHVTLDAIEDRPGGPVSQPGGGAFYSALQAARLGLRALIVTRGVPAQVRKLLAPYRGELDVRVLTSEHTTTLATRGAGAARTQRVLAWAGPIERRPGPSAEPRGEPSSEPPGPVEEPLELSAPIVHLAPVARETPGLGPADAELVGVTPPGLVRSWDADGRISLVPLDPALLPERFDAAVISEAERASCAPLLAPAGPAAGALLAVTAGSGPTELRLPGGAVERVEPIPIERLQDDLGAGDVFAAAFFVALWRGSSPASAARYAAAAAAVRVAGLGPAAIGDSASIEALLNAQGRGGRPLGGARGADGRG